MHFRTTTKILAGAMGITGCLALGAGPAMASAGHSNKMAYEFDNGDFGTQTSPWYWELDKNTKSINATFQDYGYADAGVVADLGLADNFTGITADTAGSTKVNVWVGDGSDAYTPGQHSSANFSYGFQQPDGSFYMSSGPYAGQDLTPAEIASDFAGDEVYAWVGVEYDGYSVSGSVSAINGHATGKRSFGFTSNSDGTVTAVAR